MFLFGVFGDPQIWRGSNSRFFPRSSLLWWSHQLVLSCINCRQGSVLLGESLKTLGFLTWCTWLHGLHPLEENFRICEYYKRVKNSNARYLFFDGFSSIKSDIKVVLHPRGELLTKSLENDQEEIHIRGFSLINKNLG